MNKVVHTAGWLALAGVVALGAADELQGPAAAARPPIVFTQLAPGAKWQGAAANPVASEAFTGARIALLSPAGAVKVLTAGFQSAADPSVSWDAKKILFAGRKTAANPWQIYEMNADGSGVRQMVDVPWDCRQPIYQSKIFYLDDPEPEPQISFTGTGGNWQSEDGSAAVWSLYSARLDGSGLRRLTYNPSGDNDPVMNEDGRIVYSSWQRHTLAWGAAGRAALFGVNLDGSDVAIFAGDEGRPIKRAPCVTPSRQVVFVESDGLTPDGAGNLASVDLRRNLHSYRELTKPGAGLYVTPSVLGEDEILVSMRPAQGAGTFAIYRFDLQTNRGVKLYGDAQRQSIEAQALVARPMPVGRSSVVDEKEPTGKLFCLSAFTTDLPKGSVYDGTVVKRVRVLEGVPRKAGEKAPAGELSPYLEKRVLGEFDIEADGSFHIQVPANTPIQIQTLDADGMALRSCAWIWVKNKAKRGCIGCHEDGELSPDNVFSIAVGKRGIQLTNPPEERREVRFERDVQPIVAAKCATSACHDDEAAPFLTYENLFAKKLVDPASARLSPLVWATQGRRTTRSWDKAGAAVKPMPPPGATPLSAAEKRTIVEWIDTGAHK
ncbi:MAG: hypothetical protein ABSE21_06315 [Bryobacteraceae bacterium]|jgi:hypothetical protein